MGLIDGDEVEKINDAPFNLEAARSFFAQGFWQILSLSFPVFKSTFGDLPVA